MKKLVFFGCLILAAALVSAGFDEYGYNDKARNFVGTGGSWCAAKGFGWDCAGYAPMIPYANDKLQMKWNAEWDRGNAEGWSNPPYDAWENNNWNGMCDSCSGEVWHYKIVWDQGCAQDGVPSMGGDAYCIWGQFATVMDMGTSGGEHIWLAHGTPTGYGTD